MRSITDFGELRILNSREAWPNEARDFTPWLADHIISLGDVLDMQLELTATETRVGDFCLDILAKDLNSDRLLGTDACEQNSTSIWEMMKKTRRRLTRC